MTENDPPGNPDAGPGVNGPAQDDNTRPRQPYQVPGLVTVLIGVITSVVTQLVLVLPVWLWILIVVCAPVLMTFLTLVQGSETWQGRIRDFLDTLWGVLLAALLWLKRGTPGALLGVLIFLVLYVKPGVLTRACELPANLRVVTTPESLTALNDATRAYISGKSEDGCSQVSISVTAISSIDDLKKGFTNGWLQQGTQAQGSGSAPPKSAFISPRPDIWIPDSTLAAVDVMSAVRADSESEETIQRTAELEIDPKLRSLGTSPMVAAVFTKFDQPRLESSGSSLSALFRRIQGQQDVRAVTRPSADTSEAALLTTPALYQARGTGTRTANADVERSLNPRGIIHGDDGALQAGDSAALLCHFRAADARGDAPPAGLVAIVPENVVAAYDRGDALGTACQAEKGRPSRQWLLSSYQAVDLPVLDHPFVRVRWPGEFTDRRQHAIDDFRTWLGTNGLAREGFRTSAGRAVLTGADNPLRDLQERTSVDDLPLAPPQQRLPGLAGCTGSLRQALDCYQDTRPLLRLSLLVDVSGSMSQPAGASGLSRAQDVAQVLVTGARTGDEIQVRTFSDRADPAKQQAAGQVPVVVTSDPAQREMFQRQIQQATVTGADLALTDAIDKAARQLDGKRSLVVLTDGQRPGTNPQVAAKAGALVKKLRGTGPNLRVFLVMTGRTRCQDPPVAPIAHALGTGACVDGTAREGQQKSTDDLAGAVMSNILTTT